MKLRKYELISSFLFEQEDISASQHRCPVFEKKAVGYFPLFCSFEEEQRQIINDASSGTDTTAQIQGHPTVIRRRRRL